ncbi:MAG: hypothetical protein KatS3mg082_0453 [Nitrospiraceae bacterium]|nr:MAG: hypothetical protein KatS3mg082_0453 [Nitrospiraceae bacterium]
MLVHARAYRGETVLLVHNLAGSAQPVELDLRRFRGATPIELFGESRFPPIGERPYVLSVGPYGYYWFLLRSKDSEDSPLWHRTHRDISEQRKRLVANSSGLLAARYEPPAKEFL